MALTKPEKRGVSGSGAEHGLAARVCSERPQLVLSAGTRQEGALGPFPPPDPGRQLRLPASPKIGAFCFPFDLPIVCLFFSIKVSLSSHYNLMIHLYF